MKLKFEPAFFRSGVDLSIAYLIEEAAPAFDPPLRPLLLGFICASPLLILALIICLLS